MAEVLFLNVFSKNYNSFFWKKLTFCSQVPCCKIFIFSSQNSTTLGMDILRFWRNDGQLMWTLFSVGVIATTCIYIFVWTKMSGERSFLRLFRRERRVSFSNDTLDSKREPFLESDNLSCQHPVSNSNPRNIDRGEQSVPLTLEHVQPRKEDTFYTCVSGEQTSDSRPGDVRIRNLTTNLNGNAFCDDDSAFTRWLRPFLYPFLQAMVAGWSQLFAKGIG